MNLVLDTSAVIYWTTAPERLSVAAEKAISQASTLSISSISIWEIGLKVMKDKLRLRQPFTEFVTGLREIDRVTLLPVDVETWMENVALEWSHGDPADRTIVATARLLDAPLVTSDRRIIAYYEQAIW
jgi:PIN domain nuclease of toxin-antitoxin system